MRACLSDESGFTLLEALIGLMISSFVSFLLIGGIMQMRTIQIHLVNASQLHRETADRVMGDQQIEWHIFLNQLENYLQDTSNPNVSTGVLRVEKKIEGEIWHRKIEYRQPESGSASRRNFYEYKNGGSVRLLSGVESPRFELDNGWLLLHFTFRNGNQYTGRIWVASWVEEN